MRKLLFAVLALGLSIGGYGLYKGQQFSNFCGFTNFKGTPEQVATLINCLDDLRSSPLYDNPEVPLGIAADKLSKTIREDITAGTNESTITTDPLVTLQGHRLTMSDIASSSPRLFFRIGSGNSVTWGYCTGITDNTSTYDLTGCQLGLLDFGPGTTVDTTTINSHSAGEALILTNQHHWYNYYFANTRNTSTIYSQWTFPVNATHPQLTSDTDPTEAVDLVQKGYADRLSNQGAATSTESVAGISELATQTETASSTPWGASDPHVIQSQYATSSPYTHNGTPGPHVVVAEKDLYLNQGFIDLSERFIFTGGVSSTAQTSLNGLTYLNGNVSSTNPYEFDGFGQFDGSAQFNASTTFATGRITLAGNTSSTAAISFGGNADFEGTTDFDGAVRIDGTTTLTGFVSSTSAVSFSGNADFEGTTDFDGSSRFDGTATFANFVSSTSAISFGGNADFEGTTDFDGAVRFDGTVTANALATFAANVSSTAQFSVQGLSWFNSTSTFTTTSIAEATITSSTIVNGNLQGGTINDLNSDTLATASTTSALNYHFHPEMCATGQGSQAINVTGSQVINHSLGVAPSYIYMWGIGETDNAGGETLSTSAGTWEKASGHAAERQSNTVAAITGTTVAAGQRAAIVTYLDAANNIDAEATISATAANTFTLNWSVNVNAGAARNFNWTACK